MTGDAAQPARVACVGETMVLLVPDPPAAPDDAATFRREIGGAESNIAVHLARAGHRVSWHSAVGDDAFGRHVCARLAAEGIGCEVRTDPDRVTGLYLKELGEDGTRVRYYRTGSAASMLGPADADRVWANRPDIVHTTGITAALSPSSGDLVARLLDGAPPGVLRSFDVNYRPALHRDGSAEALAGLARRADAVFCGLDEAQALWGVNDVDDVHELLRGPQLLVVKRGADGATAFAAGHRWHQPAPEVAVVEPVGAGDAFAAGVLDGLLAGVDVPDCLARGSALAGQVLTIPGDLPPASPQDSARDTSTVPAGGRPSSKETRT